MSEEFTPEQAILVAKAAGLDASDLERQTQQDQSGDERIQALEDKLMELAEAFERSAPSAPQTPEDEDQRFADQYLSHLNRSLGRYSDAA